MECQCFRYNQSEGQSCPWFVKQPMGKNTIGGLAKKMSEEAGFQARHVNHSGRKTSISNLLDAGCHPTEVAQLSGHKNLMSLNHYHSVNIDKQQQMSNIIHSHTNVTSHAQHTVSELDMESDDIELYRHSQEVEQALQSINNYEELPEAQRSSIGNSVDLPVRQSPGGSLHVNKFLNEMPQSLFNSCTFNNSVTIVMKQ